MVSTLRRISVVVLTAVAAAGITPPALAAAPIVSSHTPAAADVNTAPTSVSVVFTLPVDTGSTISVSRAGSPVTCNKTSPFLTSSTSLSCSFTGIPALTDGVYTVNYDAVSGSDHTIDSFQFTLDTVDPVAPTGLAISPAPFNGTSGALTVTGSSEKSTDTVHVSLASSGGGTALTADVAAQSDKTFAATFSQSDVRGLPDGVLTATVTSTDLAGNTGPAATKTATKDIVNPTLVSTNPVDGGSKKPVGFTFAATGSEPLGAAGHVDIFNPVGNQVAVNMSVSGATMTGTPVDQLPEGNYTAKIYLVDVAGNATPFSTQTFTLDSTVPAPPAITTPLPKAAIANANAFPVSGTGEPSATVTLTVNGPSGSPVTKTATVAGNGTWSTTVDVSTLGDGTLTFVANQSDVAGNVSADSASAMTSKDVVAPRVTNQAAAPATVNAADTVSTITGKVDNGSTTAGETDAVTVSADDAGHAETAPVVVTTTAAGDGTFTVDADVSTLADGTITYTVTAADSSANTSAAVTTTNTKDVVGPAAPTVTTFTDPINAANKAAITVAGAAPGAATVNITISDTDSGTADITVPGIAVSSGNYTRSFDVTALADGQLTATVTAVDAPGNPSSTNGTRMATKDTVAPSAPTFVTVTNPINATNKTHVVVSGASDGTTVRVTLSDGAGGGADIVVTVPVSSGNYSATVDASSLADGTSNITITAVAFDAAGNPSTSNQMTATKDTVVPGQPASLTGSPSPYVLANASSHTALTISGTTATGDNAALNLTADITVSDTDGATPDLVATGVAITSGSFSKAFTDVQVSTLTDGVLTVTTVINDPNGNVSPSRTTTVAKDTHKLTLVSTAPADNAAALPTTTASATFDENLAAIGAGGSSITVKSGGSTMAGTASVSGKTITFTPSSALSQAGSPYTVTVHGVDVGDSADTADTTYTFTVDATAPAMPTITSVTNPINTANASSVSVSGNAGEAGAEVTVTIGGTIVRTTTSTTGGAYSITGIDVSSLADGSVSVMAQSRDSAGNQSASSPATTATKDTVAPVKTGSTPANAVTVASASTVSLTFGENLGTGSITIPGVAGSSAISAGTVTFTPTAAFADGTYTATASVTDVAGNPATGAVTFTVDGTPPPVPTVDSVTNPINAANKASVAVSGDAGEASVEVTVTIGGTVTKVVTSGSDGLYSATGIDVSGLADGSLSVVARSRDAVGNQSAASAASSTTKDTVAPTQTSSVPTAASSVASAPTVSVTFGEDLGTGSITIPGATGSSSISGGTVTFTPSSPLADGSHTATATVTDAAGNPGSGSVTFTVDSTAPAVPTITSVTNPVNSTNKTNVTVSGNAGEPNIEVTVTVGGTVTKTVTSGSNGLYSASGIDVSGLADGSLSVVVQGRDAVGNQSAASAPSTTTKDTVAPVKTSSVPTASTTSTSVPTVSFTFGESLGSGSIMILGVAGTSAISGGTVTFTPSATIPDGTHTATGSVTDAAGNPATASVTFTVDDAIATSSITLGAAPSTITFGKQPVVLSGTVARPDRSIPISAVEVSFTPDGGTATVVGSVVPKADGTWSLQVAPGVNGSYSARYLGDHENTASTSAAQQVGVKVSVTGRAAKGPASKKARIKGVVAPAVAGTKVSIFKLSSGGKRKLLGTATVLADGRYSFSVKLKRGVTKVLVEVPATASNLGNTVTFRARRT